MRSLITTLVTFTILSGTLLAAPFTLLTGVYRYTKLPNGNVTIEGGSLYSSGEYTASFTQSYPVDELATRGLAETTLDAITGKFVTGADYIDSELATAEGRERLANYGFSTTSYPTDQGNVYIISVGGFTPKVPTINVSATRKIIKEGGKTAAIVLKLNRAASDELILRYILRGKAKLKSDYSGPATTGFVEIPKGKTTFRIPIRPVDNRKKESDETLVFQLSKNDGYTIGKRKSVSIVIKDND